MPQRLSEWLILGATWALWIGVVLALGGPALWLVYQGYLRMAEVLPGGLIQHALIVLFAGSCVMTLRLVEKIASAVIPV